MQTIRQHRALCAFARAVERAMPNPAGRFWLPYLLFIALLAWVLA